MAGGAAALMADVAARGGNRESSGFADYEGEFGIPGFEGQFGIPGL